MRKATRFERHFQPSFPRELQQNSSDKCLCSKFHVTRCYSRKKVFPNTIHYWKTKIKLCSGILESCWQNFQGRIREFYSFVSFNTWAPGSKIFSCLILLHLHGQSRCVYLEFLVPRLSYRRSSTLVTKINNQRKGCKTLQGHTRVRTAAVPSQNIWILVSFTITFQYFCFFFGLGFSEI